MPLLLVGADKKPRAERQTASAPPHRWYVRVKSWPRVVKSDKASIHTLICTIGRRAVTTGGILLEQGAAVSRTVGPVIG